MFCRIIPKLLLHKDICEISDDHNPGAFNVFKHCGKGVGIFCLLLDVLKGFIPILLASLFTDTACWAFAFVMAAPVLGHAVGMFNCFHGGKCISVSFGVMFGILAATWIGIVVLAALYILFSTVLKIKSNRIRSINVYAIFGVATSIIFSLIGLYAVAAGCGVISIIAIVKHLQIKSFIQQKLLRNEERDNMYCAQGTFENTKHDN